jgi:hypothetical protein
MHTSTLEVSVDPAAIRDQLDARGYALTPVVLSASVCRSLAAAFDADDRYRSTVDMARHRFGSGTYRYFADPLPPIVQELRRALYPPLAVVADEWAARVGERDRFPSTLDGFLRRCRRADQDLPTPLVFRYEAGDFNALHQDVYGPTRFPLQAVVVLDRAGVDFTGGELVLVTNIPRRQSTSAVVSPERGRVLVFPNAMRPVSVARGWVRAQVRHGVSEVHEGRRHSLGIIFHDARS